ncbi:MAG: hypothetical protein KA184_06605 [Candidatus Hydrogenedentes bacterium]|nr:hypothetical protein [Candidatus Hydrogenedentota bacterium]
MKHLPAFVCLAAFCLIEGFGCARDLRLNHMPQPMDITELDEHEGQPVDIAPWAYSWRADRAVQERPEAYFIPRRLERLDRVYRTAYAALPPSELKSIYYDMPDLLSPLPPAPTGQLQAALLWTGGLSKYQVELVWPDGVQQIPSQNAVEVRVYPTSYGWFGWTVDKILAGPELLPDHRTWTYRSDPMAKMDWAYSTRVDAATEMVAVFYDRPRAPSGAPCAVPDIRVTGPSAGNWKRMDVEIEWGFQAESKDSDFDGWLEPSVALFGPVTPLAENNGVRVKEGCRWQSRVTAGTARRGIFVPLLYAPDSRPGLDSRITVWSDNSGFTFRISDLEDGPILIPEHGAFVTRAGSGQTARQFAAELAARNLKSIRQMTREHREAASWEELMREVRLWTCPEGTIFAPFPAVEDPPMQVELPDRGWTDAWRAASFQLKGKHMWGGLAFEVARVAHEMDLVGLHAEADKVYEYFLQAPGAKPDGDYTDGDGALEYAASMRHDMGYSHDGTHASTGRLLFAMAERYFLTGDKDWFQRNRARLQAAADWIIRQRTLYMKDIPNRRDLHAAGLMPPCMLGDYAIPSCDWHWYYVDNALSLQGLQRFADALSEFDPEAGRKYHDEAKAFREDLRRAVNREAARAPVRLGRDGMFHSYIPRMAYAGGIPGPELGAPQFPDCDRFMGALPLAEPFAVLDASDTRITDTLDVMEEWGTSAGVVLEKEEARKSKGLPAEDAWFWNCFVILPKASHNANIYLLQDDIPSFLRFWMNSYASVVGADGKLWEHWHLGNYDPCGAPDNGTAGWFMENFRNLLVMEEGRSLWIARATPRAWLEQGKRILVRNAPTYFGPLSYETVSHVDNGEIAVSIEIPSRRPPDCVLLRVRHPRQKPIASVRVNDRAWNDFDRAREVVRLHDVHGTVNVVAIY